MSIADGNVEYTSWYSSSQQCSTIGISAHCWELVYRRYQCALLGAGVSVLGISAHLSDIGISALISAPVL